MAWLKVLRQAWGLEVKYELAELRRFQLYNDGSTEVSTIVTLSLAPWRAPDLVKPSEMTAGPLGPEIHKNPLRENV